MSLLDNPATIWGGELFVGSVREGLARVACLRPAMLAGGDAAACVSGAGRRCPDWLRPRDDLRRSSGDSAEAHARRSPAAEPCPFPFEGRQIDFRPLGAIIEDRRRGRDTREIADAFHAGVAGGLVDAALVLCDEYQVDTVVLSAVYSRTSCCWSTPKSDCVRRGLRLWTNRAVPPNDGGISLGQAALAALG